MATNRKEQHREREPCGLVIVECGLRLGRMWNGYVEKSHKVECNKEFLCITCTVEHTYILLSSTVTIQLHVSVLYVDHLQVEIFKVQISYSIVLA